MACKEKPATDSIPTIKVTFQPKHLAVENGWLQDAGALAEERGGMTFGWSFDNTSRAKYAAKPNAEILMNSSVAFPPPVGSMHCPKDDEASCTPINWSIQIPNGTYHVKAMIGDPDREYA